MTTIGRQANFHPFGLVAPSSEPFLGSPRDAVDRRRRTRTHSTPFAACCFIQRHPPRSRTPPPELPSARRKFPDGMLGFSSCGLFACVEVIFRLSAGCRRSPSASASAPHVLHSEMLYPTTSSAAPCASVGASVGAPQITTSLGELLCFSHFISLPFHVNYIFMCFI